MITTEVDDQNNSTEKLRTDTALLRTGLLRRLLASPLL